jgi:hypothetical protein
MYDFFLNAKDGEIIFHWEWERRGNFRSYWISEFDDDHVLNFYAKSKTLYSLYNNNIMTKSEADKLKEKEEKELLNTF